MTKSRLCKLCRKNPATVPDRDEFPSVRKQLCAECHRRRLLGDIARIVTPKSLGTLKRRLESDDLVE